MIASVCSSNGRRIAARTSAHRESVRQAVGGRADGNSGRQDLRSSELRGRAEGVGARTRDHEGAEVQTDLKNQTLYLQL